VNTWIEIESGGMANVGAIHEFVSDDDPRPVREQLDEKGGGWLPMQGFSLDVKTGVLTNPGDPPYQPMASTTIRDELVLVYQYGIVAVVQKDETFEAARMIITPEAPPA